MTYLSRKVNPIAYGLNEIQMAVFGVLTLDRHGAFWKSEAAAKQRWENFDRFIECCCHRLKLRSRELVIYCKTECDEDLRGHFHFLIGRQGMKDVTPEKFCETGQELWKQEHGRAEIDPFDAKRQWDGVKYQSKLYECDGEVIDPDEFLSRVLKGIIRKNNESATAQLLPPLLNPIPAESCPA